MCVQQVSRTARSCVANAQIPEKMKRPAARIPQPRTAQPSMEADLQGPKKHLEGAGRCCKFKFRCHRKRILYFLINTLNILNPSKVSPGVGHRQKTWCYSICFPTKRSKGKYELQKTDVQIFLPIRDVRRLIHDIFLLHNEIIYIIFKLFYILQILKLCNK